MKKERIIERLKRIWQYRCNSCLANTGGCSCAEEKDKMILELINDLSKDFSVGEKVIIYSRFKPIEAQVLEVKREKVKVQLPDGRIRWRNKLEVEKK